MARTVKTQVTGNTEFTGSQYTEFLATRIAAMKGFAEGTVTLEDKNAARAQVRNARNAIRKADLTVEEWRKAEEIREAALTAPKRSRSRKPAEEVVDA